MVFTAMKWCLEDENSCELNSVFEESGNRCEIDCTKEASKKIF